MPKTLQAVLIGCLVVAGCAGTTTPADPIVDPAGAVTGAASDGPGELIPNGSRLVIGGARALALGTSSALSVTLRDANGYESDVTQSVTWQSSDEGIVAVNRASKARAVAEGSADITAAYSNLSARATLSVGPAIVTELALTTPANGMAIFDAGELAAIAKFSDGHSADVTTATWWTTSNPQVAFPIAPNAMLRATGGGTAVIGAWYGGVKSTVTVEVSGPALMGLAIDPPSLSLQPGDARNVRAMALFEDSTTAAIPLSDGRFVSTDSEIVAVWHDDAGVPLVTAVGEGQATVHITFAGLTADALIDSTQPVASKPL